MVYVLIIKKLIKTIQKYSTINNDEGGGGEEEEGRNQKDIENPSHSRDNSKDRRVKQNMAIFHGFSSWIQLRYLILAICSGFQFFIIMICYFYISMIIGWNYFKFNFFYYYR